MFYFNTLHLKAMGMGTHYKCPHCPKGKQLLLLDLVESPSRADNLSPLAQFQRAELLAHEMPRNVSVKIGNGSFRDKVEWNQAMRDATRKERMTAKIEPRRGYRLITFEL